MSSTSLSRPWSTHAVQPSNRHAPTAPPPRRSDPSSKAFPTTPMAQDSSLPSQPGTWRHPHLDAIAQRQNRSMFGSENSWSVVKSAVLLLISLTSPPLMASLSPDWLVKVLSIYSDYYTRIILVIRLFFLANLVYALRPLVTSRDDIDDIPLTPSQRALLGLPPSNTPLTPHSDILTPPRYSRLATPKSSASDREGSPLSHARSPLSGRGKGRDGLVDKTSRSRANSGSSYSGSPLVREALTGSAGRRLSFDTSRLSFDTSYGGGSSSNSGILDDSPTPVNINAGQASVGLNNKWLYQHSRGSPNARSPFCSTGR